MRRFLEILGTVVVLCVLAAYILWAVRVCSERKQEVLVETVDIMVADTDSLCLVTPGDVLNWIEQDGISVYGVPVEELDTGAIEEAIRSRMFVRSSRAYTGLDGVLHIEVAQRIPVMRVINSRGCDFYLSQDAVVLPVRGVNPVYVPLVTGDFALPFRRGFTGSVRLLSPFTKKHNQSYIYLRKLINFVGVLSASPFWNAQIVQIEVNGADTGAEPKIELVTRIGSHRIIFGSIDDSGLVAGKLDKLQVFYNEVLSRRGWDAYTVVDVSSGGQIVCRRGE